MNKISNIIKRKGSNTISVLPDTSVLDTLKVMAENNIGSVVIMDNGKFLGIITERDYSRKVILKGKSSVDTKVKDIMTTEFPGLSSKDSVEHCMELMTQTNLRYLPVFNDKQFAGIISISDVIKETILVQQETIAHLDNYINSR